MPSLFTHGHALLIGAGGDLPNTVDDANGLASILVDPGRCAYPEEQVICLTGEVAPREAVLTALDGLAQRVTADDTVIVYFSGHGYRVESPYGPLYFLMPYGYKGDDLPNTAIRGDEFRERLAAIPAQKLLLLLDCCHAGGLDGAKLPGQRFVKAPLPAEGTERLAQGRGRVVIASSQADELSYAGQPYSAFTLALLEALCGVGASRQDGYVRAADLALHAREKVPQRTGNRQHPILHFDQADNFVVSYYAGGEKRPKGLPFPAESIQIEPQPGAWTLSGHFEGPVAIGDGDAIDLRGSTGSVVKPTGPVIQHFHPEQSNPVAKRAEAVERRYLEGLYAECNAVPLAGDAPPDTPQQRHPRLQHIYVDLDTRRPPSWERIGQRLGILSAVQEAWREAIRPVSVLKAIREHPQLVLLGDPGSGKSTLTRRLAGVLAAAHLERLPPEERDWQAKLDHAFDRWLLPIRVTLSSWANHLSGDAEGCADDLLNECLRVLGQTAQVDASVQKARLLERMNQDPPSVLLLLDGLDEVADPIQRQRLLAAVQHFCRHYPNVPLLVTCRVRPYREREHYRLPLPEAELAPLSEGSIRAFVARWHEELAWAGYYHPENAERAATRLLRAVFDPRRPELREMAGTPLLLTMMARVNYDAPLPDSRAELYERFVAKLLWEWEREKLDDQGQSTRLQSLLQAGRVKPVGLERALNRLAYRVHGSQGSRDTVDIPRAALREALEAIHPGDEAQKAAWAVQVLDLIDDRSGLLLAVEQRHLYRFSHRTFQEYLAARWLATGSDFLSKFREKMDQEQWREAIFLALGYQVSVRGDYDNALAVFDELMPEAEEVAQGWRRVLLLGQAYWSLRGPEWAGQASEERRARRVQRTMPQRLAALLVLDEAPVEERLEAGDLLAGLGDPRKGVGVVPPPGLPPVGRRGQGAAVPEMDWVEIPAGPFTMGSDKRGDRMAFNDETPQFTCTLITEPYHISRYPVTVAQYRAFAESGGYRERRFWTQAGWAWRKSRGITGPEVYWEPFQRDNHPVVGVSWYEAVAYCRWLSQVLGYEVRLPREAEWEKAARGEDGRIWPWGDEEPTAEHCNFNGNVGHTTPVGSYPRGASPYGVLEMAGNVWEWCCTKWRNDYTAYQKRIDDDLEGKAPRVVRGGSWIDYHHGVRCGYSVREYPSYRSYDFGFRVVAPGL